MCIYTRARAHTHTRTHAHTHVHTHTHTYRRRKRAPKIELLDSGELLIKTGDRERLIGIREFKRYYAQRYRPEEERDSVKASQRERLLLCYRYVGTGLPLSVTLILNLLDKMNVFVYSLYTVPECAHAHAHAHTRARAHTHT